MANRISELEAHLRQWESGKQKRTAAFTLVPIAAALGVGWYAQDRVGSLEQGLDDTLASLEAPMVEEDGGAARLARLDGLRDEVVELRALPDALSEANAERETLTTRAGEPGRRGRDAAAPRSRTSRLSARLWRRS